MSSTYKADGVNVSLGDQFSSECARILRPTYGHSHFVRLGGSGTGFRGARPFQTMNVPHDSWLDIAPDGIGTKTILHAHASFAKYAYTDALAMVCGDITRYGGLPIIFSNVFDVASLGEDSESPQYKKAINMMEGLAELCIQQGVVAMKGETAELGTCIGSDNPSALLKFNVAGFAIGVMHPDKQITGDTLAPGQIVVALQENGFRSNGISSVRTALVMRFGDDWFSHLGDPEVQQFVDRACTSSVLYDRFLATMNGWYDYVKTFEWRPSKIHAIAHITGGGIESKFFNDMLKPRRLSATLDNLYKLPSIMKDCADIRHIDSQELYSMWNGGQGVLVVLDESDVDQFIIEASNFQISAQVAGRITQTAAPSLTITSMYDGKEVIYI